MLPCRNRINFYRIRYTVRSNTEGIRMVERCRISGIVRTAGRGLWRRRISQQPSSVLQRDGAAAEYHTGRRPYCRKWNVMQLKIAPAVVRTTDSGLWCR